METTYFYLVNYYNCLSEKNGEKRETLRIVSLINLTHLAGAFEHTVVLRAVKLLFHAAFHDHAKTAAKAKVQVFPTLLVSLL